MGLLGNPRVSISENGIGLLGNLRVSIYENGICLLGNLRESISDCIHIGLAGPLWPMHHLIFS